MKLTKDSILSLDRTLKSLSIGAGDPLLRAGPRAGLGAVVVLDVQRVGRVVHDDAAVLAREGLDARGLPSRGSTSKSARLWICWKLTKTIEMYGIVIDLHGNC